MPRKSKEQVKEESLKEKIVTRLQSIATQSVQAQELIRGKDFDPDELLDLIGDMSRDLDASESMAERLLPSEDDDEEVEDEEEGEEEPEE